MTDINKIVFFVFIAFVISFTTFFITMSSLPDYVYEEHKEFYSQDLPGEKIFIFGSSQTYPINPMLVSENLNEKGHNYIIYHLGQGSFDTEERLRTVDLVVSQKPEIVIYGIAYQTFYSHGRNIIEKPADTFVELPKITDLFASVSIPLNTGLIDNPKYATINTINYFRQTFEKDENETITRPYPNTPFFGIVGHEGIAAEKKDLEVGGKLAGYRGNEIYPMEKNRTYTALKELIHELHSNEIEVIIFTVPHHKNWLEQLPIQQKQIFDDMLEDLEQEFGFEVFRLHDKYDDELDIWVDHDHLIAFDKKTDFYSQEIAKMLLTKMDGL